MSHPDPTLNLVTKQLKALAHQGRLACATRMMQAVVPEMTPEVFMIPKLTSFDSDLFSIKEMPEEERKVQAFQAARTIAESI